MGDGKYRLNEKDKIEDFCQKNNEAYILKCEIESLEFLIDKMYESIKNSNEIIKEKEFKILELLKKDINNETNELHIS